MLAALAAFAALLALPGIASAALLKDYTDRCPVDDPEMLAGQAALVACAGSTTSHGTFKIRDRVVETGTSNLQFGFQNNASQPVVQPIGTTIAAEPSNSPGGLLGIRLPDEDNDLFKAVNDNVFEGELLGVRTQVQVAGPARDFTLGNALQPNSGPVIKLPVKVRLINPVLGASCYIGSNDDPILLQPQTTRVGSASFPADPDDPEVFAVVSEGGAQADDSFAVPEATGCGPLGLLDAVVNQQLGLPSPAGNNAVTLEDQTTALVGDGDGVSLAEKWHEQNGQ